MARSGRSEEGGDIPGNGFPLWSLIVLICVAVGSIVMFLYRWYKKSKEE